MFRTQIRSPRKVVLKTLLGLSFLIQIACMSIAQDPESAGEPSVVQETVQVDHANTKPAVPEQGAEAAPNPKQSNVSGHELEPVIYHLPQGPAPDWLDLAFNDLAAEEDVRSQLKSRLENVEFKNLPFKDAIERLSEMTGVTIHIDQVSLESAGVDIGRNVNFRARSASFRQVLLRILRSVGDAELRYKIEEDSIVLVTLEKSVEEASARHYDLAYLLPNSANLRAIMGAIQENFQPDNWQLNGGTFSMSAVGSLLVVSADEDTHYNIERLLARIRVMDRVNLESPPAVQSGMEFMPNLFGGKGVQAAGVGGPGF